MKTLLFTAAIFSLSVACSSSSNKNDNASEKTSSVQEAGAISDYMALKDALVQSDVDKAKSAAAALSESLENTDASIVDAAQQISQSNDLEEQRTRFKVVTDGLIKALKSNGVEESIYVQYCPMAFENKGASWLSMSEEIRNPYFGDRMLKCGRVEEVIE